MVNPCNLCNGHVCCYGGDPYCDVNNCCDPFFCFCHGLVVKDDVSSE